jgi:hypothetical protein
MARIWPRSAESGVQVAYPMLAVKEMTVSRSASRRTP